MYFNAKRKVQNMNKQTKEVGMHNSQGKSYLQKQRSMVYFPGGKTEYLNTLRVFLNFVDQNCPVKEEVEKWFADSFDSKNVGLINKFIITLKKMQLITEEEGKFKLTVLAENSSEPQFTEFIFNALDKNYLGINETLDVLYKKSPLLLGEIVDSLKEVDIDWDTNTQVIIRLNWLISLGYVVQKGPLYMITYSGRKVKIGESKNENIPSHEDLKNALIEAGKNNGLRSSPEYKLDFHRLDVVWFNPNEDIPVFAAEIQLNERDLELSLSRLACAENKHIYNLSLYTKKEFIAKAQTIQNKIYPDLDNKLDILPWSEIIEEKKASEMFKMHFRDRFRYSHVRLRKWRSKENSGN